MKKGQIITIYEDIITREKPEGKVKLIRCLNRSLDYWEVEFIEDKFRCERFVEA